MPDEKKGRAAAIAVLDQIAKERNAVELHAISDPRFEESESLTLASVPAGRDLTSLVPFLDEYLVRPLRRKGTAKFFSESAFIEGVNRFKGDASQIFADPNPTAPTLTAVLDYHAAGTPEQVADGDALTGWCQHKALLALRMSREWLAWYGIDGKKLDQVSFAAFIADHIQDVIAVDGAQDTKATELAALLQARIGGPGQLMALSRGLEVNQRVATRNAVALDTGEIKLSYMESQEGDGAGGAITTPSLFFITIPIFYGGEPYRVPVRLRYRVDGAAIAWSIVLFRPDLVFEDAFAIVMRKVADETDVKVLLGAPEA